MFKFLILTSVVWSLFGQAAMACEAQFGQQVHILLGRNQSSLTAYTGNVILPGASESKVEFQSCFPSCFRWVNNCAFFPSRASALEASQAMDRDHTSFFEGAAMAGGALILLGVLGATDYEGDNQAQTNNFNPRETQSSQEDDTTLQGID